MARRVQVQKGVSKQRSGGGGRQPVPPASTNRQVQPELSLRQKLQGLIGFIGNHDIAPNIPWTAILRRLPEAFHGAPEIVAVLRQYQPGPDATISVQQAQMRLLPVLDALLREL